jgi:methylmalonyl-CoA mutase N-terminal domain/subunit
LKRGPITWSGCLQYFRRIDESVADTGHEKGFFQAEIADAAYRYQREIDEGTRKIVGVNAYQEDKPLRIPILQMDSAGYQRQVQRLADLRNSRDNARVGQALDRLRIAAQGTENTMPILDAVRVYHAGRDHL